MVELKAVTKLEDVHLAQAMNYCQAYNLAVGLLLNYGAKSLEFEGAHNLNHRENKYYVAIILKSTNFKNPDPDR